VFISRGRPADKPIVAPRTHEQRLSAPEPSATADGVYGALEELHGGRKEVADKRRHERQPWATGITIWVLGGAQPRRISRTTHDVSCGGLCFMHDGFLEPGAQVRIRFDSLAGAPVVPGRIANCIYVGSQWHRVGVAFDVPGDVTTSDPDNR